MAGTTGEYVHPTYPDNLVEPVDKCGGDSEDLKDLAAEVLELRVKAGAAVVEQT